MTHPFVLVLGAAFQLLRHSAARAPGRASAGAESCVSVELAALRRLGAAYRFPGESVMRLLNDN